MFRFLLLTLLIISAVLGIAWYSAQTLPNWYQHEGSSEGQVVQEINKQIQQEGGAGPFLGKKLASILNGELVLSENEFNALLLASLKSSEDGRKFLLLSDAVNAQIEENKLEIGAVVNLDKVAKLNAKARSAVEKINSALPLLNQSKVFLSVSGKPVAKSGNIGFSKDFSVKIGAISVPSELLQQLGVPIEKVAQLNLPVKYMRIKDVVLSKDQIKLVVSPKI